MANKGRGNPGNHPCVSTSDIQRGGINKTRNVHDEINRY